MPFKEYQSDRLTGTSNIDLPNAIPSGSVIISIMVECLNSKTGTVTLQTKPTDGATAERMIYIDYITGKGYYTGNSAKEFYVSQQTLDCKITGGLEVIINILFWSVKI